MTCVSYDQHGPTPRARWLRRRFVRVALCFFGTVLFGAPSASSQFDSTAPEPLAPLGGTVLVGGGGSLPGGVYRLFVELAGGEDAKLAVLSFSPSSPVPPALTDARLLRLGEGGTADEVVATLEDVTGAWLVGAACTDLAAWAGKPVEKALQQVIERRGVVGCNGAAASALTRTMITGGEERATLGTGLDLIPGAVVDGVFAKPRRLRMLDVVARQPRLVGLGIEERTVMVLRRRFFDVLGAGSVYACLAGNAHRPVRIEQVNQRVSPRTQRKARDVPEGHLLSSPRSLRRQRRGARLEDLVALSRAATARTLPKFPADEPPTPHVARGSLMIVGGGGSPPGFMDKFMELAGGRDALLVYVPCTEGEEANAERTLARWRRAGATNVAFIHTKDRREADTSDEIHDLLRRAGGLFFGGGRQWNLVDSWQHTEAHRLMHEVLERGGVIAGSSAGASIQGSYMPRGNSLGNRDPMAEGYETGLGFLTGVAIDQHFSQRGRQPDMTALVNTYPQLLGIGLDEASSIIVQGSIATCFSREGRGVFFYDRRRPVVAGQPDYLRLANGQKYDLAARIVVEAGKAEKK